MKLLINTLLSLSFFSTSLFAQKLEVSYQEIVKVNPEEFKNAVSFSENGKESKIPNDVYNNMIKEMQEAKDFKLTVFNNETSYNKVEKLQNGQGGGMNFSISFGDSGNGLFKNLTTREYFKNVSLFSKSYTIKDKLKDYNWKLTRETKKIIGFDVKKATVIIDSTKSVVAWYAPSITVKDGPSMYNGLPGLILELEIINTKKTTDKGFGNTTIRATEVKEVPDMKPIEKPKEKNVINEKEYKELSKKESERYKSMKT